MKVKESEKTMEQRKDYGKTEICLLKKKRHSERKIYMREESTYDFKGYHTSVIMMSIKRLNSLIKI